MNGIQRVKRLIAQKKILCTQEVWDAEASGNSFRKAILSYAWDGKESPKKDGKEDPLDALRYDVINWSWRDTDLPERTIPIDHSDKAIAIIEQRKQLNRTLRRF
jgi:hypothetical protein